MNHRRFVVASDSHGDQADPDTERALFSFISDFKPQLRIHAGDAWDFRNLRRGASDDEKAHSLEDDWQAGSEFLRRFFDGGKENYFLRGNHDERLWSFADSATGLLRDYAHDGIARVEKLVKKSRAKMLPYDSRLGVLKLGDVSVIHGYHAGVSAARNHANVYGSCLFGHVHAQERTRVASIERAESIAIGCICKTDMDYSSSHTGKLRWANGWAFGWVLENGRTVTNLAEKTENGFSCATGIKFF